MPEEGDEDALGQDRNDLRGVYLQDPWRSCKGSSLKAVPCGELIKKKKKISLKAPRLWAGLAAHRWNLNEKEQSFAFLQSLLGRRGEEGGSLFSASLARVWSIQAVMLLAGGLALPWLQVRNLWVHQTGTETILRREKGKAGQERPRDASPVEQGSLGLIPCQGSKGSVPTEGSPASAEPTCWGGSLPSGSLPARRFFKIWLRIYLFASHGCC